MRIGFIGLGFMGGNMAVRLLQAGHALTVHDLDRSKADRLIANGAAWAASPAECAAQADFLITSLPGPPQCEAVMRDAGALDALRAGAIWADMTTNRKQLVLDLARQGGERGVRVIDAPVTGAVDGARRGELTIFAGGEARDIDAVMPAFDAMGRVIRCGELGTGNVVKLVTNLLWFIHATALGEGLALGVKGGVELGTLWEAIKSSVGDSFVARHDAPSVFAGHYDPSFTTDLCLKDLGLVGELAAALGVPTALGDCARGQFEKSRETYGGSAGELHVVKLVEDAAKVGLRLDGDWPLHWEA